MSYPTSPPQNFAPSIEIDQPEPNILTCANSLHFDHLVASARVLTMILRLTISPYDGRAFHPGLATLASSERSQGFVLKGVC